MHISDKIFTDEQLSVGKILVLEEGHKLTIAELKKNILAKKVKKIKWNSKYEYEIFILISIYSGLNIFDKSIERQFDVYYVDGDNAVSEILRLKSDAVRATLQLGANSVMLLYQCIIALSKIKDLRRYLKILEINHTELLEILNIQNLAKNMDVKTKLLSQLSEKYADAEIILMENNIKKLLQSTW